MQFCKLPDTIADSYGSRSTISGVEDSGTSQPDGVSTTVVTIIGAVIAVVTLLGAVAVIVQGKSSVEKAEKARDAAAADDNR